MFENFGKQLIVLFINSYFTLTVHDIFFVLPFNN